MLVTKAKRAEWFTWIDTPLYWTQAHATTPGLMFLSVRGQLSVRFHLSHMPLMPDEVQAYCFDLWQRELPPHRDLSQLRSYQANDVMQLRAHLGVLLTYVMRLGKTAVATHLHDPADGIFVAVGPLSSREAWKIWTERTFGAPCFSLTGRTPLDYYGDYASYFAHFDVLGAHTGFLGSRPIGTLVLDEVHLLQARGTKRLSAVSVLAPRAHRVLGLTGTPMWNKPKSLWTLLHLVSPGAWGTQYEFKNYFCDPQPTAYGMRYEGASNVEELRARLDYIMVRRTWEEVAPELPPSTRVLEPVPLTGPQYTAIEAAAMKLTLVHGSSLPRYRTTLRLLLARAKIPAVLVDATRALAEGHKVVIWTWHNEIADEVQEALAEMGRVYRLRAEDSQTVRECNIDDFRADPTPTPMVASMIVGGAGLDLACADYAIFAELDYTPANLLQAEMRTFHISRPHTVVFFYTDDPIETALIAALDVKNGFAAALNMDADRIFENIVSSL